MIGFGLSRRPLTYRELITRTIKELVADNGLGLAAQLAYYFFFSLFPALLVGIALASFFPLENFLDRMVSMLGGVVPADVITIIEDQIQKISEGKKGGILTLGLLLALWSSSAAIMGLVDALNRAYDIEDTRPWWRVRLLALVLTLALAAFILVAFALVLLGPTVADHVALVTGLGPAFAWAWKILHWPVVLALAALGADIVYYFAPDAEQDWVWATPGSVLAAVLWLLASLAFRYYVTNFGAYQETYGAIGGVMVLLLWFYMSGLVLLMGAELNAEIEHASPYGKAAAETARRGQRRAIGALALGRYQRQQSAPAAVPRSLPIILAPPPAPAAGPLRRAVVAAVAAVVIFRASRA